MYPDFLEWTALDEGAAYSALSEGLGFSVAQLRETLTVRGECSPLTFMSEVTLVHLRVEGKSQGRVAEDLFALAHGSDVFPLDGTSAPILAPARLSLDQNRAGEFVRFCLFALDFLNVRIVSLDDVAPAAIIQRNTSAPTAPVTVAVVSERGFEVTLLGAAPSGDAYRLTFLCSQAGEVRLERSEALDGVRVHPSALTNGRGSWAPARDCVVRSLCPDWLPLWKHGQAQPERSRQDKVHALGKYLDEWLAQEESREAWTAGVRAFAQQMKNAQVFRVERRCQAFMPTLDVLRLTLKIDEKLRQVIFLSQAMSSSLPRLWPIGGQVQNLYAFNDFVSPGSNSLIDISRTTAPDYAMFSATELITGSPPGTGHAEFLAYPFRTFASFDDLPLEFQKLVSETAERRLQRATTELGHLMMARLHVDAASLATASRSRPPRFGVRNDGDGNLVFYLDEGLGIALVPVFGSAELTPRPYSELPSELREGIRAALTRAAESRRQDISLVRAVIDDIRAASAESVGARTGWPPDEIPKAPRFGNFEYDRNRELYRSSVFMHYNRGPLEADERAAASQLFAAILEVNRATGVPKMTADCQLLDLAEPTPVVLMAPELGYLTAKPLRCRAVAEALRSTSSADASGDPSSGDQEISPEAAMERLVAGARLTDKRVTGSISVCGTLPRLELSNCRIEGVLSFDNCEITGDVVLRSVEADQLVFADAKVGGDLDLYDIKIGARAGLPATSSGVERPHALSLTGAHVAKRLRLVKLTVRGVIDLSAVEIGLGVVAWEVTADTVLAGQMVVRRGGFCVERQSSTGEFGIRCTAVEAEGGKVSLTAATITGDINLCSIETGLLELNRITATGVLLLGSAVESRSVVTNVNLSYADVPKLIHIQNLIVIAWFVSYGLKAGRLEIGAAHNERAKPRYEVSFGRNFEIEDALISGALVLRGVHIQGTFRLARSTVGDVVIHPRLASAHAMEVGADAHLLPTKIRDGVELHGCTIAGALELVGTIVDERTSGQYAVDISACNVAHHVQFWTERMCEDGGHSLRSTMPDVHFLISGKLTLSPFGGWSVFLHRRNQLGNNPAMAREREREWLELTREDGTSADARAELMGNWRPELSDNELASHLSARHLTTVVHGDVRLNQCTIGLDLALTNLLAENSRVILSEVTVSGNLLAESRGKRYPAPAGKEYENSARPYVGLLGTVCAALEVHQSEVKGYADLTGLRAGRGAVGFRAGETVKLGAVLVLSGTRVHQAVRLIEVVGEDFWHATLCGTVDFSGARTGLLRLSGRNWPSEVERLAADPVNAPSPLIRCCAAEFTTFEFVSRLPPSTWPKPGLDLTDTTVATWGLDKWTDPEVTLGTFLAQLVGRSKFRVRLYQQIEAFLHGAGHDDEATNIYRDFVWRRRFEELNRELRWKSPVLRVGCASSGESFAPRTLRIVGLCAAGLVAALGSIVSDSTAVRKTPRLVPSSKPQSRSITAVTLSLRARLREGIKLLGVAFGLVVLLWWGKHQLSWESNPYALVLLYATAVVTPFAAFAELRAYALLLLTALNRLFSGNFTSWPRTALLLLLLVGFSTVFFLDRKNLDIASLYKRPFYENLPESRSLAFEHSPLDRTSATPGAANVRAGEFASLSQTTVPAVVKPLPTTIAKDVCGVLKNWKWPDAMLLSLRFMSPVPFSLYEEIDVSNSWPRSPVADSGVAPAAAMSHDLVKKRCQTLGEEWQQSERPLVLLARVNPTLIAFGLKLASSLLLTLLGATVAAQLYRKPGR